MMSPLQTSEGLPFQTLHDPLPGLLPHGVGDAVPRFGERHETQPDRVFSIEGLEVRHEATD